MASQSLPPPQLHARLHPLWILALVTGSIPMTYLTIKFVFPFLFPYP